MADDSAERSPTVELFRELGLPRNAKIGFALGIGIAVAVYVYRIAELLGPVPDTRGSPVLFALLAFVLAVSMGALLTVTLTVVAAIRRARRLD
ncbi:MAG: hypothetical protein SVG88_02685 [Halobacteriales archaeon]|nr:hypothetical protein [Halobacteriales archaeon]